MKKIIGKILFPIANRFISKWFVLAIDVAIVFFCFIVTYVIRFNFDFQKIDYQELLIQLPVAVAVNFVGFLIFESYSGVIRHTSLADAKKILKATTTSAVILVVISILAKYISPESRFILPFSIIAIHYLLNTFLLNTARFAFKAFYLDWFKSTKKRSRHNVLIFGAGSMGLITKESLERDTKIRYQVIGFVDDNPSKVNKSIEGIKVYSQKQIFTTDFIENKDVEEVIISIQDINSSRKKRIIDLCLEKNIVVKQIPPLEKWINGELSSKQIRNVRIEDILGRDEIKIDDENILRELSGKTILVTGAAGSIGSEIVRQVLKYIPRQVITLDQAETPMFELESELKGVNKQVDIRFLIADITNTARMEYIFKSFAPDIVFHAAAYKHVPLMEEHPMEAINCNVLGTKIVSDLSLKYGAEKFVMVSTDKAVNPTNVMGATKRLAEMYVQSLNLLNKDQNRTKFITTRFGNVLGSNGSVITIFRKQIAAGGPLKVTHPDITRYFMTIPEACMLVLEAGAMGKGGEIFIFDMGESVKIIDLAKKMIKLSGLTLNQNIKIEYTGLRPGEKLYEELLNQKENTIPTHNEKIMVAKIAPVNYDSVNEVALKIQTLIREAHLIEDFEDKLVFNLKAIVPEYKSQNSKFEKFDKDTEKQRKTIISSTE